MKASFGEDTAEQTELYFLATTENKLPPQILLSPGLADSWLPLGEFSILDKKAGRRKGMSTSCDGSLLTL
jgi:hypothetical protein